ncbi:very short patch repair endonuclease [Burkholderia ubonensis]|uniref:very short patch repair endonuclease n=1 Tax=Burkholderia ubonensis TaxID=101571 RepID=UPI0009B4C6BE|nr:very short patch repair endonuclease [Burkholderia ubonensis]
MIDVLTPEQRRFNMSRIGGRHTRPELLLRQGLHARGLRFRLHGRDLPGCPDLVFPKYGVCLFVNGCFWHGHGCTLFKMPKTRAEFWENKIAGNRQRDARATATLLDLGWRVLVVWECAIRGRYRIGIDEVLDICERFLVGDVKNPKANKLIEIKERVSGGVGVV